MSSLSSIIRDRGQIAENDPSKIFSVYPPEEIAESKKRRPKKISIAPAGAVDPRLILDNAAEKAASIEQEAIAEAKQKIEQGYNEGLEKGYLEGKEKAAEEIADYKNQIIQNLKNLTDEALKQKEKILFSAEPQIVSLAVAVAKKIIESEISADKNIVKNVVRKALEKVVDTQKIRLRISPGDYETIKEDIKNIILKAGLATTIDIVQDKSVDEGGCLVETEAGNIDARISVQLEELEKSLRKQHGQS